MIEPKVSIVLPIYNVEKYLDRCIDSVVEQTYRNIEILLIDDGSPDKCPEICDRWAQKDSRIRVIHKHNEGLGMARNTGIEQASGEYICFFDSDDYIALDTVEKVVARAVQTCADAVVFGVTLLDREGKEKQSFVPGVGDRVYDGDAVTQEFLPDFIAPDPYGDGTRLFYMSAWVLMYSVKLIKDSGFRFVSEREIISEDVYSLLSFFHEAKRVAVLPLSLYYYCDNGESLSRRYVSGRYEKIRHFYMSTLELCDRLGYSEKIKHRVTKPYLAFTLSALKAEAVSDRSRRERMDTLKNIINDPALREVLEHNKKDRVSSTRRIMFFAMRVRLYRLCMLLLRAKGR